MAPHHPECDMLQRFMNWTEKIPPEFNTVTIEKIESEKRKLNCYGETFTSGWCGTCQESALPGEPGYCGTDAEDEKEKEARDKTKENREKPRPTLWGGWGYCSKLCTQTNYQGWEGTESNFSQTSTTQVLLEQ